MYFAILNASPDPLLAITWTHAIRWMDYLNYTRPERLQSSSIFIGLRKVRRFYSTVLSSARCPHHTSFLTMSLYAVVCSHLVLLTLGRHSCVLSGGVYPVVLGDALPEREPLTRAPWLLPS